MVEKIVSLVGGGGRWELSVLSVQFFYEPKTSLKNKAHLIKRKKRLGPVLTF